MGKTKKAFPVELVEKFRIFLTNCIGISFSKDEQDLEKKLFHAVNEFGYEDPRLGIEFLLSMPLSKENVGILAKHFTIGETYFFRDPKSFATLENSILPEIIRAKQKKDKKIKIWCAACSTGEEPYSIAITLYRMLPDIHLWDIQIVATDINPLFLEKAREGHYKKWSFRGSSPELKTCYFTKIKEDVFTPLPKIRKLVKFLYINLVEDTYPDIVQGTNEVDLILCNNVLIYFSSQQIENTIRKLTDSLLEGGWLCVTATEAPYVHDCRLDTIPYDHLFMFKKNSSKNMTRIANNEDSKSTNVNSQIKYINQELPIINTLSILEVNSKVKKQSLKMTLIEECLELFQKKHYIEVIAILEKHLYPYHKNPSLLHAHTNEIILLVKAYANQGQLDHAKNWCEIALKTNNLDPLFHYLYATILLEKKFINDAIKSLNHALYLNPDFVVAHFAMGMLANNQGEKKETIRHFRNATKLLKEMQEDSVLPGSEDVTCEKMLEMIGNITKKSLSNF